MEVVGNDLVKDYENSRDQYVSFARTIDNLLVRLLASEGISVHSIGNRCKTINSFKGKLERKNAYTKLVQITDLAGVRLITHYEDDVDRIAKIIESEFSVDHENSIDKRKAIDPEKFGYLSLHYVVSLSDERAALREYATFRGMKVEIQVRSILQHTWAEIEHDTGYKTDIEIPKHIRRRFSRLAGLLELADQEFMGIRDALVEYSENVTLQVEQASEDRTVSSTDEVSLDKISLGRFIELDSQVLALDTRIAEALTAEIELLTEVDSKQIQRLKALGINTLSELRSQLESNAQHILRRAEDAKIQWPKSDGEPSRTIPKGICLLYLAQVLIAKRKDEIEIRDLLSKSGLYISDRLVDYLLNFF